MTTEPADWAKIKAYQAHYPDAGTSDAYIISHWADLSGASHELARMYSTYEQPPVDPDLLAAREYCCRQYLGYESAINRGHWDYADAVKSFLAGIQHERAKS